MLDAADFRMSMGRPENARWSNALAGRAAQGMLWPRWRTNGCCKWAGPYSGPFGGSRCPEAEAQVRNLEAELRLLEKVMSVSTNLLALGLAEEVGE